MEHFFKLIDKCFVLTMLLKQTIENNMWFLMGKFRATIRISKGVALPTEKLIHLPTKSHHTNQIASSCSPITSN